MTQLTLNIDNPSALRAIRALVKNMTGVEIAKRKRKMTQTGYELAMEDVRNGNLTEYSSVKELIRAAKE